MDLSENANLEMWILRKMSFWKCEFSDNWAFRNVNFAKNENNDFWIMVHFEATPSIQNNKDQIKKSWTLPIDSDI